MARRVISLYTGAGGMDYGFEAAGFETAVALELDPDCCRTLKQNRSWPVIDRSIFEVPAAELLAKGDLKRREVDLVIGGPPCQPFSKSGWWARGDSARLKDPRADTLREYVRVVEEVLPRAFVLENVAGLAFNGKDEGLRLLLNRIKRLNEKHGTDYRPAFKVIDAADYGVPQRRHRFFLVAARDGTAFQFPERVVAKHRTAWDALGDLPAPPPSEVLQIRGQWAELVPTIPEGKNYLFHTDRGGGKRLFGWRTRYWTFLLKLAKDRPSWTIQAQPGPAVGPFHWKNRRLTVRELARLQTFRDDIELAGNDASARKQLGNAVPSLLAEVLGREIRRQLLGERGARGGLKLLPPDLGPPPPPEAPRPVPPSFRELIGDHPAHPGTGKGPLRFPSQGRPARATMRPG